MFSLLTGMSNKTSFCDGSRPAVGNSSRIVRDVSSSKQPHDPIRPESKQMKRYEKTRRELMFDYFDEVKEIASESGIYANDMAYSDDQTKILQPLLEVAVKTGRLVPHTEGMDLI